MMETWWDCLLVSPRASRAAYGVLKCVCFCWLRVWLTLASSDPPAALAPPARELQPEAIFGTQVLIFSAVAFCLICRLPVLWEGRRYPAALAGTASQSAGDATR